jgi:hypothetical protein
MQGGPIFRRRHSNSAFEHTVEARDGAETGSKYNLGDAHGYIHQQRFRFFYSDERDVFSQGHSRGFLENLAEMETADINVLRHQPQRYRLLDMGKNKLLSAEHWLGLMGQGRNRMASGKVGQILGEDSEQMHHGLKLSGVTTGVSK